MTTAKKHLFVRFLDWKNEHVSHDVFIIILSVLVGLAAGISAVVIKNSVHGIEWLLTFTFSETDENLLYFIYPLAGLILTVFVTKKLLFGKDVGHGIPNTLYAISKRNSIIQRISMLSSVLTSALTVGFGGSTGLEGPTVGTSAAIGSNIGRAFRVNYKTRTLLIGCAAAGALASIFNAPIAAIVFAIEVIMLDLTMASMIPLLMASVSATLTSRLLLGQDTLFHFDLSEGFTMAHLPFYILLGLVCGLFSLYFTKIFTFSTYFFSRFENRYVRVLIGGSLVGLLVFFLPPLFGEGFETINSLIDGKYSEVMNNSLFYKHRDNIYIVLIFLFAVALLKAVATSITLECGGVGGIFGPTLFMGSTMGFAFSKTLGEFGIIDLSVSNFTLVGMAGLMAGNLRAPLTAVFLIAEITGGYDLFVPLMLTSAIAFLTAKNFTPHSIYTMQLAKRGELITHDRDAAVLTLMRLREEIETNFEVISPEMNLGQLVKVISRSSRNIFPVVDEQRRFQGVVDLNDIRETMFNQELYTEVFVSELMHITPAQISINENMNVVMEKFESTGAWNLPVLENGLYVGFVSKSKLFSAYRGMLQDFYKD